MVRFFTNKIFKIFSLFFIPWIGLGAEVHLDKLIEYDQYASAKALQEADLSDLWNYFLKGQADLFFSQEAELLATEIKSSFCQATETSQKSIPQTDKTRSGKDTDGKNGLYNQRNLEPFTHASRREGVFQ